MDPKIEITFVLRSEQIKSLMGLENRLLALLDNNKATHQKYKLDLQTTTAPADRSAELRLILLLTQDAWNAISMVDILELAMNFETILFVRELGGPVIKAFFYRIAPASDPVEQAIEEYLARNYGNGLTPANMFLTKNTGYLKPEILTAFYKLQTDVEAPVVDEPAPKPTVYAVDLTDEEIKKRIKDSLGIRNPAYDLTAVTVNSTTFEVTYTIKSALWGEKEYKVIRNDINTWPLIKKEEN